MTQYLAPHLIQFPKLGAPDIGYISVCDPLQNPLPFVVQRVFWTYYTPESIVRGRPPPPPPPPGAVAVAGRLTVMTELATGELQTFRLENPDEGLYVPPNAWHTIQHSHTAVQLVLASGAFDEADYIRDYDAFRQQWTPRS